MCIPLSPHLLAPSIPITLRLYYELPNYDESDTCRKEPAESSVTCGRIRALFIVDETLRDRRLDRMPGGQFKAGIELHVTISMFPRDVIAWEAEVVEERGSSPRLANSDAFK